MHGFLTFCTKNRLGAQTGESKQETPPENRVAGMESILRRKSVHKGLPQIGVIDAPRIHRARNPRALGVRSGFYALRAIVSMIGSQYAIE